jgi:23S rRNA (uracil1939-C5)-methyltransferase
MSDAMNEFREFDIVRIGAQGDGVAAGDGAPVFVPFTLPGERVRTHVVGTRMQLREVLKASFSRVAPICRHFGVCGGCALQHLSRDIYGDWKREQVIAAFASRGIEAPFRDLLRPTGLRRRAAFTARKNTELVEIGFHQAGTHDLVDLLECPVLDSHIVAALPGLRTFIAQLLPKSDDVRVGVTMTGAGLDVTLDDVRRTLSPDVRTRIARDATVLGLARVSIAQETIYESLPPFLRFGTVDVNLPAGIFIQAMAEAEHVMAEHIIIALGKVKSVVDLFSGIGAFSFPIASLAKVQAFDSDARAIDALNAAVKKATGIKPVTARVRDLFREPLSAMELNDFDAVVFDPPRAGAEAQAQMISKSKVKTVVAVSCNPATLARDARVLIDGGYTLEAVTPIDQFQYSPHIEAVAVFKRVKS